MYVPYSLSEQSIIHSPCKHLGLRWFFSWCLLWHERKFKHRRYHHALAMRGFLQQRSTRHPQLDIQHQAALGERDLSWAAPSGVVVVLSWSQQGARTFCNSCLSWCLVVLVVFGVEHNPRESITFIMEKNLSHMWPVLLNKRHSFFSFFLLSLFAPLNVVQQLEEVSDTRLSVFFLPAFLCPYGHNFCVTQPCHHGVFWLGTLALTTGSLRSKIGGYTVPATSIHPILNPFKVLA